MNKLTRAAVSAAAALALTAPVVASVAPAEASSASSVVARHGSVAVAARKAPKIKIKLSAPGYNQGSILKVTATAKVPGVRRGKVRFTVGGVGLSAKIKKGKATVTLPSTLTPGVYPVVAKLGRKKGVTNLVVWSAKLQLNSTAVSVQYEGYNNPQITGSVEWKGAPATHGYVDFYLNGQYQGGSESPSYVTMTAVESGGTFDAYTDSFADYLHEHNYPAGVYNIYAFYTEGPGFDDYIYSSPIAVTYNPTPAF